MGLFGDKDLKVLNRKLESGWLSFTLIPRLGSAETIVNNVGNELLEATQGLVTKGRANEARKVLRSARRPEGEAVASLWNELLDKVDQAIPAV